MTTVDAEPADENIVSLAIGQRVVAGAAKQPVFVGVPHQNIVPIITGNCIAPWPSQEPVGSAAPRQPVSAFLTVQLIASLVPRQSVSPGTSKQLISARATVDDIIASASKDDIVASSGIDDVVSAQTNDAIRTASPFKKSLSRVPTITLTPSELRYSAMRSALRESFSAVEPWLASSSTVLKQLAVANPSAVHSTMLLTLSDEGFISPRLERTRQHPSHASLARIAGRCECAAI